MTYCIGMKTTEGLVFASDSRTNAGLDNYSTYKKMFSNRFLTIGPSFENYDKNKFFINFYKLYLIIEAIIYLYS